MATATQETHTTSVTVKLEPPECGTELKRCTSLDPYRGAPVAQATTVLLVMCYLRYGLHNRRVFLKL